MPNVMILIPARSGSRRIENKNIRVFGDKPLLGHVITNTMESNIGRVIVSTNSNEIAEIARSYGAEVPFLRPEELSDSKSSSIWCITHALEWFKRKENWIPEIVAFCPPTNPFLKKETIQTMAKTLLKRKKVNSIVSVVKSSDHPFTIIDFMDNDRLKIGVMSIGGKTIKDVERSQDWPEVWKGSAACRITRSSFFFSLIKNSELIKNIKYTNTYDRNNCIGFKIDYLQNFDVNTELDWSLGQHLFAVAKQDD